MLEPKFLPNSSGCMVVATLSVSSRAPAMMEAAPKRPGYLKRRRAAPKPPME